MKNMEIMLNYRSPGRTVSYEMRRMEESELRGGKAENAINTFLPWHTKVKRKVWIISPTKKPDIHRRIIRACIHG